MSFHSYTLMLIFLTNKVKYPKRNIKIAQRMTVRNTLKKKVPI